MECILVIDQGTTGTQAALYDCYTLEKWAQFKVDFYQHFPQPGWVEHQASEIWQSVQKACLMCLEKAHQSGKSPQIRAIGITNQRESCLAWDITTGEVVSPVLVWQDRRTAEKCEDLQKNQVLHKRITQLTGLNCDPYFSATKMSWILENIPQAKTLSQRSKLGLGTIDCYLISRLTGFKEFVTDHTNASRTMLYELESGGFSQELCQIFGIPFSALPRVLPSLSIGTPKGFGTTKDVGFLPNGIPILSCLGDQQSALYGHDATTPGSGKLTFGTGSFALLSMGTQLLSQAPGLLQTVAMSSPSERTFALEGSAFSCGCALDTLVQNFKFLSHIGELENLLHSCSRDPHLMYIPALTGLGAPWWLPEAKGALFGLTRGTHNSQIAHAVCEAIVIQNLILLETMAEISSVTLKELRVDGGPTKNKTLMQMQADSLGIPLNLPMDPEVTALGVAKGARVALGIRQDLGQRSSQTIDPRAENKPFWNREKRRFKAGVEALKKLYDPSQGDF